MEDQDTDSTKDPSKFLPEVETSVRVNRSVPRCLRMREAGCRQKTNATPIELQWSAEDGMVRDHTEFRCQLPDVTRSTFLVVFSPDGKKVASTHGNHNVYVTDLASGKNIKTLTGHPRTPWCIAFHPSSNQILATGCLGGQVRVWDLTGGSEIWMAESQTVIASLAFHPVDRMLVIASYNELHFWDWSQPQPFAKCFTSNEKEKVRYVAFDTLGHKLMTGVANLASRPPSQWDRVAAPQPTTVNPQLDSERRITICYRYMVEQYEQLVQRYYDLSRTRSTLTMDRGTDPMEFEAESSDSPNNAQDASRGLLGRRLLFCSGHRPHVRLSSGTDEASASHSSTNFMTPPEHENSPPVSQPLLASSSSADSIASETPSLLNVPRRTLRFDITLPSFSNFRSCSPSNSTPNPTSSAADLPSTSNSHNTRSPETSRCRPLSRLSLSPEATRFQFNQPESSVIGNGQNNSASNEQVQRTENHDRPTTVRQLVRNLVSSWYTRENNNPSEGTSTEVPSGIESENEESDSYHSFPPEPLREDASNSGSGAENITPWQISSATRNQRNSESSGRQFSEASAVSQLRSQFHRLQSAYENRNSSNTYTPHTNVFSPETQAAERRLLNRLNEFLDRPLPESRARRIFAASRRSAFQPRPQPHSTSLDTIGGVRYGIQLLSRHIDNMQRLCRARLEILQLQQIRRMWEDLQSQIYALHGAVRDGQTEESAAPAATQVAGRPTEQLTDDDSDGPNSTGELHWRMRRTPQTGRRNSTKTPLPRAASRFHASKRSKLMFSRPDLNKRLSTMVQTELNRRQPNRQQPTSSNQGTSEERAEASSSTGTSDDQGSDVRGVKRKSLDPEPLFRPRPLHPNAPSTSTSLPSTTANSTSSLAAVMRETIVQLENMVRRHRQSSSQRNTRLSRFTRQREERRMRHLWDTESSHESSRDDQSEGDSSQQRPPAGMDSEWSRESTRLRARQVLLLMVDSLTQFFENDNLSRRTTNEALNDRIHNLYVLLQLALNLTDLLLAQLVNSRRELEARRPTMFDCGNWNPRHRFRFSRYSRYSNLRNLSRNPPPPLQRNPPRRGSPTTSPSSSATPPQPRRLPPTTSVSSPASAATSPPTRGPFRQQQVYSFRPTWLPHPRPVVPIVRVNDLPPPPAEEMSSLRYRPQSPPPVSGPHAHFTPPRHPPFPPHRFLHPGRYVGSSFVLDESTSEDSSSYDRGGDFSFLRANYGASSVFLTDTSTTAHHRIQAWDFSKYKIPDLSQTEKNVVVSECKIHNDASVDMSKDDRLLVTLLPSGRLNMTTLLGIYSLQWSTLGQLLYTTSFEQSIVSVSLSPTARHLVAGLASRRVAMTTSERQANAQVFKLEGGSPGRKGLGSRGRLVHVRDLELSRHLNFISLNCIRWAPISGQGLVYGTNTGHLKILR